MPVARRRTNPPNPRGLWARTNNPRGVKINNPDGWVTDGPVWWLGSDSASAVRNGARAGHSSITKASNIVTGTIATGRWTVTPGREDQPRWLTDPMLCRPDGRYEIPPYPSSLRLAAPYFWGQWIRSALLWGLGALTFIEDDNGLPSPGSAFIVAPWFVTTDPTRAGSRSVVIDGTGEGIPVDYDGRFVYDGRTFRLVELRNPLTPVDTTTGMTPGVLEYHAAELGMLTDMVNYAGATFTGGGVPSGYLKVGAPQITQRQADDLKAAWMAAHGSGSRGVAVLNATTSYEAVAVSPVDAALADMTRLSLVSVANAFSIPYSLLGAPTGDSMTYSNLQMDLQALEFALQPWVRGIESTLGALLPQGRDLSIKISTTIGGGNDARINGDRNARPGLPGGPAPDGPTDPGGDVPAG